MNRIRDGFAAYLHMRALDFSANQTGFSTVLFAENTELFWKAAITDDPEGMVALVTYPFRIPPRRVTATLELLDRANTRLDWGGFFLARTTDTVHFKLGAPLAHTPLSVETFDAFLETSQRVPDTLHPALLRVINEETPCNLALGQLGRDLAICSRGDMVSQEL